MGDRCTRHLHHNLTRRLARAGRKTLSLYSFSSSWSYCASMTRIARLSARMRTHTRQENSEGLIKGETNLGQDGVAEQVLAPSPRGNRCCTSHTLSISLGWNGRHSQVSRTEVPRWWRWTRRRDSVAHPDRMPAGSVCSAPLCRNSPIGRLLHCGASEQSVHCRCSHAPSEGRYSAEPLRLSLSPYLFRGWRRLLLSAAWKSEARCCSATTCSRCSCCWYFFSWPTIRAGNTGGGVTLGKE